jgi:hypothetical protein
MASVPLGLTGQEDVFLLVAVGPLVLAIVVVWIFWRWAKRSEAAEKAERERGGGG